MRKSITAVVATLAAFALMGSACEPKGTVHNKPGVIADACQNEPKRYALTIDTGATVTNPDGSTSPEVRVTCVTKEVFDKYNAGDPYP
jgi:hypothetical protein